MNGLFGRIAIVAGCSILAAWFAWLNGGERVDVHLGIVTLNAVPVSVVVFASILVGMSLLFFVGLRADLRTRRMIHRYREALGRENSAERAKGLDTDG